MAKTRSGSVTENRGGISSSRRDCVNPVTNGVVKKSSRPSTNTRSSRSMKGSLKSTRVPWKRSQVHGNRDDCKEKPTNRPSRSGRKRNLSLEEFNDSTSNKKARVASSEQQKEDLSNQTKEAEGNCSWQGNAKKAGLSKHTHNQKKNEENLALQTNSVKQEPLKRTQVKRKSPLKRTHEKTPENPQASPRKDKHAQKKLNLDVIESSGEQSLSMKDTVAEGNSSEESSDDEAVAWEDVDEAHVADHVLEAVQNDGHEPSTSQKQHSPSKKSVEISITMPGSKRKKKGWDHEEFLKYVKRAVNRYRKEVRIDVHKVHLLTLVAHGIFRNGICNEPMLQGVLLSHVPNEFVSGGKRKWDVARMTSFLKWFHSKFSSIDDARIGEKQIDKQIPKLGNLSEVLVAILRALGLLTRLVYSMQPLSVKDDVEAKSCKKNQKKKMPKGNTPGKTISEENLTAPGQAKKEKAVVTKKDVKKENEVQTVKASAKKSGGSKDVKVKSEVKSPVRNSVVSVEDSELNDAKQNEGKVKKCMEKENKKLNKTKHSPKTPKGKGQVDTSREKELKDARSGNMTKKKNKNSRPLRKRRKVDYSLSDNESEIEDDEDWNDQSNDSDSVEEFNETKTTKESSKSKGKTPLARKKRSTESDSVSPSGSSGVSFVDLVDNDSDFEVTSKPLARKRQSFGSSKCKKKTVKIISSDESDGTVTCLRDGSNEQDSNWWVEVYLPAEKKWTCVHLESSSINHPELCEKQATQPLVYVVAFDNKNSIKDVTNRYASSWMSKTRKLRIDAEWWEDTLRPYKSKNKKMDEMEDSHIEDKLLEKPLPTSIAEFKNHPLYVLKRHLLKFEAIYPETAAILGYCRGEAVFSRECVHTLHTREKWLNEALVVKQGEKAYKVVKGRPKRNQPIHERDSVTIDLFGRWQTEQYKPPPAKDGKVPRNEYGNVELFLPCMLPPGTKHIQINGIQRIAKKLNIDCAQAVVGFDFHCGFSHPVIDGVVVCEEFEQVLLDAWREEEEQAEKRKAEKREKRMLANWKLLTRSLLIRERLKKRYDTEEPKVAESSNNAEGETVMDTSVSWPLNRQEGKSSVASDGHCHVFPESGHKKDSVTGEWTKSCSCGLTLPFEKM